MAVILSKTLNGRLLKCKTCNKIHLEYKNLNFNFTKEALFSFTDYVARIDSTFWANENKESPYHRKVVIPIVKNDVNAMFHPHEIGELKILLNIKIIKEALLNV